MTGDIKDYNREDIMHHFYMGCACINFCTDTADLNLLQEMEDEISAILHEMKDKIEKLRDCGGGEGKYTLKQLRQAWAAGRLSVEAIK